MKIQRTVVTIVVSSWLIAVGQFAAADWPTYRGDSQRSGYTSESLPIKLSLQWEYKAAGVPDPAWSGRDTRMPFDRAYHTVIADGRLFFGSSADGKIRALDAATGVQQWEFTTGAPVRFAPVVWKDRVFATSDDGHLFCLAADDGRLLWKLRGGPDNSMVSGNGHIVSRWPARGGPVVADGIVYFAAGIWPSEGIFICAVDAANGKTIWCNDTSGSIVMDQPHPTAVAKSGVSAQGNLVVAGDTLLVPTGRAVAAAFRRTDGKLLYFHLQKNGKYGGSQVLANGGVFFNRGSAFDLTTGVREEFVATQPAGAIAGTPGGVTSAIKGRVGVLRWIEQEKTDRKGKPVRVKTLEKVWSTGTPYVGTSLIVAGQTIVSAGRDTKGYGVCLVDTGHKKSVWSAKVDGVPWGLAVADGRLYVSTERGTIYCFGSDQADKKNVVFRPQIKVASTGAMDAVAKEIIRKSGVVDGYCVDLGCGDGSLALALAQNSKLQIYAIDPDPRNVTAARKKLSDAGLYGVRVVVHQGDPASTSYPNYFADLAVSARSVAEGSSVVDVKEMQRLQCPFGGVACIGRSGNMKKTVRGPLDGVGSWTHQYCDPANTNCSTDTLVKGPLGMLWFDDLNFVMPSRHGRGPAPLFLDGRLFVEGLNGLLCVNAYNGRKLWHFPLPNILADFNGEALMGVSGTGSNFCVLPDGLYLAVSGKCLRIDPTTGKLLATFSAPTRGDGKPNIWGYIACEGNTLFGSLCDTQHRVTYRFAPSSGVNKQLTESNLLFALDAKTGELKWRYKPKQSIRHNAIAVGDRRVYLIDRPVALGDHTKEVRRGVGVLSTKHLPGTLIALDADDGRVIWKNDKDIYGTLLALSTEHKTLLMCYQDWRFKLVSEFGGRMAAFDTQTGLRRWDVEERYRTRPIINGKTVYFQPGAWNLLTGKKTSFEFKRSYGCGILSGSKNLLVYRSATLGYTDLFSNQGTENYGGIRPGCWINTLPVGGLVLMPDATDGCTCSYLIKSSIALQPYGTRKSKK